MTLSHKEWVEALKRGELLGVNCTDCDSIYGTPFVVCNECGGSHMKTIALPTEGNVYSETTIEVPPKGFRGPYQVGIVQLGRARVMACLEGNVEIDDKVVFQENFYSDSKESETVPVFSEQ